MWVGGKGTDIDGRKKLGGEAIEGRRGRRE